jgi:hypothetical protein
MATPVPPPVAPEPDRISTSGDTARKVLRTKTKAAAKMKTTPLPKDVQIHNIEDTSAIDTSDNISVSSEDSDPDRPGGFLDYIHRLSEQTQRRAGSRAMVGARRRNGSIELEPDAAYVHDTVKMYLQELWLIDINPGDVNRIKEKIVDRMAAESH